VIQDNQAVNREEKSLLTLLDSNSADYSEVILALQTSFVEEMDEAFYIKFNGFIR